MLTLSAFPSSDVLKHAKPPVWRIDMTVFIALRQLMSVVTTIDYKRGKVRPFVTGNRINRSGGAYHVSLSACPLRIPQAN
ncbi:hypothetical protein M3I53_21285 [Paraburkholderia sp. CNPSo 3272]|uniref:hypothetical protein n=1 Tax=Paraburkholderia sp. CNPSo 3272 TaxID=2940931 RepID=UPI0020B85355|nr:hypothetical protein [Paraburkholderia sp. CNPSo 3272]MCP3725627.1 hypothetical protein [Paraburkholderia sp. CNPSo 3272]